MSVNTKWPINDISSFIVLFYDIFKQWIKDTAKKFYRTLIFYFITDQKRYVRMYKNFMNSQFDPNFISQI